MLLGISETPLVIGNCQGVNWKKLLALNTNKNLDFFTYFQENGKLKFEVSDSEIKN